MANLFGKNKLREIATKLQTSDLEEKIALVKTWHNDYHKGSLKLDKETSREQAYNQDFFIKILGYQEKPAVPYSFEPKATTDKGQLPDAVLSHTDVTKEIKNIAAAVELKGASIDLDRPQRREGNMSPVQQGFKYKTQYRNCPFVVVSNFWEFRLYHDNQLDYELWTLDDLVDPEDDYLKFKTFYTLLHSDNLTTPKGASKTEGWLSDVRFEQEEIGKKFYRVYREARLDLLRDIYQHNESVRSDIDMGIEKAQKIIDRIVFACFAEDRGLLPDDTLQRVIQAADGSAFGGSLWSIFKAFFEAIDVGSEKLEIPDGYNGGLFAFDSVLNSLKVSDKPLRKVASISNYNFEEDLSVNILGHIFEQSISDLEEIKSRVEENENLESLQQSRRKKDGIFYTPDYIVRYIVDNSLGAYLREEEERLKVEFKLKGDITDKSYEKRERQAYGNYQEFLQNIKVVDPACGSGAFLVYVFDYLLAENKRVASILGNNLFSSEDYIKSILQNNIYGVDLNDESVEITKLSLWLKSAQKGKKLTTLDNNIKCGNSLIDDPDVAGDKAFNWQKEFPEIFAKGGFDVVVGNPPYVFTRGNISTKEKAYYSTNYSNTQFKLNTYILFTERAYSLIKQDGGLGFIMPNNWLTIEFNSLFRKFILENTNNLTIINSSDKIFKDASVDTAILLFNKGRSGESSKVHLLNLESEAFTKVSSKKVSDFLSEHNFTIHVRNDDFASIDKKVTENSVNLSEIALVKNGIQAYTVGEGSPTQSKEMKENRVYHDTKSNGNDWFPYIDGADMGRYFIKWSGQYVKWGRNLSRPRIWELFKGERLIVRQIPSKLPYAIFAAFTDTDCINDNNGMVVKLTDNDFQTSYVLGILNSKLMSFWFAHKFGKLQRKIFPQFKVKELSIFPITKAKPADQRILANLTRTIEDSHEKIKDKTVKIEQIIASEFNKVKLPVRWWTLDFTDFVKALKVKLSLAQKDELVQLFEKYSRELIELDNQIQKTDQEIDKLVYKLYNLTSEEIATVEKT